MHDPNSEPRVSVIIPVFDCASRIPATLASVAAQTMMDFEVIVVYGAPSRDLAAAVPPADPRFRLLQLECDGGLAAARNSGVAAARGRYVAFLDPGDRWMPDKLERQLTAVADAPDPEQVFCVTLIRLEFGDGRSIVRPTRGLNDGERADEYIYVSNGFAQSSSMLVSRALANRVPWRPVLHEDHLFFIEAMALGARYVLVHEVLTALAIGPGPDWVDNDLILERGHAFLRDAAPWLSESARLACEFRLRRITTREDPLVVALLMLTVKHYHARRLRHAMTTDLCGLIPAGFFQRIRHWLVRGHGRADHIVQSLSSPERIDLPGVRGQEDASLATPLYARIAE